MKRKNLSMMKMAISIKEKSVFLVKSMVLANRFFLMVISMKDIGMMD